MKTGKTLTELATEIERQAKSKRDFRAPVNRLRADVNDDGKLVIKGIGFDTYGVRPTAHQQFATFLGIHANYYNKCLEQAPDLLARNFNHWLNVNNDERLVRTLDGDVRAFMSGSYRQLDNLDLAESVLPQLATLKATVVSSEITENRMYLKATTDRIEADVKVGDIVQAGLIVSNSEVGQGSLSVEAMDYRLSCLNGMIREEGVRKRHVGRSTRGTDALEDAREFFRDATRRADDRAFFLKVQDAVRAMFDQTRFDSRIRQYREAAAIELPPTTDVKEVVEVVSKRFSLTEAEGAGVLNHLIRGGDLSKWGLANSVTRAAADVESYDRSQELEAIGGKVIELSATDWAKLAV